MCKTLRYRMVSANAVVVEERITPALAVGSVKQSGKDKFTEMMCCG